MLKGMIVMQFHTNEAMNTPRALRWRKNLFLQLSFLVLEGNSLLKVIEMTGREEKGGGREEGNAGTVLTL